MIRSITLLGSSSGRNAGDAALMSGIMDSIDKEIGTKLTYEIPTISPSFVRREYTDYNTKPISIMPWNLSVKMLGLPTYNSILRTDLSVIFDAVLFDRALYNPLFNFLSSFYLMLPAAKKKGKLLGCYNCGLGPVTTKAGRTMLRDLLEEMDFIAVRDEGALRVMEDIGVKNPNRLLTADAALNAPTAPNERIAEIFNTLGLRLGEEILGINVNKYLDSWAGLSKEPLSKEQFVNTFAEAINGFLEKYSVPVLFVTTQHHDIEITSLLKSKIKSKELVLQIGNETLTHMETKGVLGALSLLVSMRLHAGILATSELTPIVGLAYQPKVKFYADMLGQGEYCHSFANFNVPYLTEAIVQGWEAKQALKAQLAKRIPELKWKANNGAKLVAALHQGLSISHVISELNRENIAHGYGEILNQPTA